MPVREVEGDAVAMITPDPEAPLCADVPREPFGTPAALRPLWGIEEEGGIEVLGRFSDGTAAAAALRRNEGMTVYIGTVNAPAKLLRNILKASGVHVYLDSDDALAADGAFLSVTATSAGIKAIRLPRPSEVQRVLPEPGELGRTAEFAEPFEEGETRIYLLRND
jgi:hypothetical protein